MAGHLSSWLNRIERSTSKKWRGSVRRIISAVIYNLSCFSHGCSTGWVSGVLGGGALSGGAWLAALPCLAALPAAPFLAVLADARGRKAGALVVCLSFIVSGCLCAWSGSKGVWAGRAAAGAGGAGALALAPLYCAEIAPGTRGLAAMPALASSCGILFAYTAGPLLSPHALSLWMAVPPAVLMVSLLWLPETPSFLISVGRIQDAAKVMCWFNGSDFREDLTDVIEQQEVRIRTNDCYGSGFRSKEDDTFQPMLKRGSGLESTSEGRGETSALRQLFRDRRNRRALLSCFVLVCVAAGSGAGAVSSFAAGLLRHSVGHTPLAALALDVKSYNIFMYNGSTTQAQFGQTQAGSLLCGTALVLGAAVATVTVDKVGRKLLLICSCSGIACCLAILGAYCDPRVPQTWSHHLIWPHRNRNQTTSQSIITKSIENGTKPSTTTLPYYVEDKKSNDTLEFGDEKKSNELLSYAKERKANGKLTKYGIEIKSNESYVIEKKLNADENKPNEPMFSYVAEQKSDESMLSYMDDKKSNETMLPFKDDKIEISKSKLQNQSVVVYDFLIKNSTEYHYDEGMWPPIFLLSMVLFLYNVGLGSVPFVLISELFSMNVRSLASSLLISWMWMTTFLLLRYFATVASALGLHGTYYLCSIITFLGSIYTYLTIPETKGKTDEQINEVLNGSFLLCCHSASKQENVA